MPAGCPASFRAYCYQAMITQHGWMFLSSFENLRIKLLNADNITNLMHMENMVLGIAFGTVVTSFLNSFLNGYKGTYNHIKLSDIKSDNPKTFPVMSNRFSQVPSENFFKIPGKPIAYWVSDSFLQTFETGKLLGAIASPKTGMTTGDNNRFLRFWFEVDNNTYCLNAGSASEAKIPDEL